MDLPLGLSAAIESGRCVLFVGAGLGYNATLRDGTPVPDGVGLATYLAGQFGIDLDGAQPELPKVAQLVEMRHGRADLIARLKSLLDGAVPDENLAWLFGLTWSAIFTTNYDGLIETCYARNVTPMQIPVVIATNSEAQPVDGRIEVPIFHLHGSLQTEGGAGAVLITESDYAAFRERRSMLFERFKQDYATATILYIGYSHNDPNWRMISEEVRAQIAPGGVARTAYRIAPSTPQMDREILYGAGVQTLDGTVSELREAVLASLGDIHVDPVSLDGLRAGVPSDLAPIFDSHRSALTRLLGRWEYVNQADFDGADNFADFLKGSAPAWSVVGRGRNFERDLEEVLVEDVTNFATDSRARVVQRLVLGPAGYGMTTLLMAISAWIAQNRAAKILFHRAGQPLEPADVEFAVREIDGPLVLVIDDVSDYAPAVSLISSQLRDLDSPVYLLMGSRLNEWRQRHARIPAREFALGPLSDDEIDRLVDMLDRENSLGDLQRLSSELRVSKIKVRNQQELLVTMREVTEGAQFDAIVENEFHSIDSEFARGIYAIVSMFARTRSLIRDSLLAEIADCNIADLFGPEMAGVEGIVKMVDINGPNPGIAFHARHQIIADIVWLRSIEPLRRQELALSAVRTLNVSYALDAKAFESFLRTDNFVDSIHSLDGKIDFFETAIRKDPTNPYVRQHYARMLRREGKLDLALRQVESALESAPRVRVLWHTKATILRDMAVDRAVTQEIAERRLAQSESAYRSVLNLRDRDEYAYNGLAELFLDWARRLAPTNAEASVIYARKCEEVIRDGLSNVRDREGMYIASAKLEEFLGDLPSGIDELRKAVNLAPSSIIASYLLGAALRRGSRLGESMPVLERALELHPEDPRLARLLAVIIVELSGDYEKALSTLSLAALKGGDDPDFIATHGGMLAMAGRISDSEQVWTRASSLRWPVEQQNRIGYRPRLPEVGNPRLRGTIVTVKPGFGFISSPGLPDFFLAGSRFAGVEVRVGLEVVFTPAFSVRGPLATEVEPA